MSFEMKMAMIVGISIMIALTITGFLVGKNVRAKRLNPDMFTKKWREIQAKCREKHQWPDAIVDADELLNQALKKRRYKGKRMGERMVAAQRLFSDNDGLWSAHNLAKQIIAEPTTKIKETDVKKTLTSFRQALKDIGAFRS